MQPSLHRLMMTAPSNTTSITIAQDDRDDCQFAKIVPNSKRRRMTNDAMMMMMMMPPPASQQQMQTFSSTSSSQEEPPRKRVKKSVRFANAVEVAFRHVSQEDLSQSWYTEVEYRQFVEDIRHTVRMIRIMGNSDLLFLDPSQYCVRGIEEHVVQGNFQFKRLKLLSNIRMILSQQDAQRCMGVVDPNAIKMISMMCSRESRARALELAALDSTDRLNYY